MVDPVQPDAEAPSEAAAPPRTSAELLAELRGAPERGEIAVRYQPQLDLRTDRIIAVEALARWIHPIWGMVPPDEFVPVAETAGMIEEITESLIATACRDGAAWHAAGHRIELALNVSADQLQSPGFVGRIVDALAVDAFPPSSLTIEITQSQLIDDYRRSAVPLRELAAYGVDVSIDDFGTGYSSLSRLSALPATEVKIDKSILDSDNGVPLINLVVDLARANGLRVVVEGVETKDQLDLVRRLDCDRAQGFYIAKPLGADEITELLARE